MSVFLGGRVFFVVFGACSKPAEYVALCVSCKQARFKMYLLRAQPNQIRKGHTVTSKQQDPSRDETSRTRGFGLDRAHIVKELAGSWQKPPGSACLQTMFKRKTRRNAARHGRIIWFLYAFVSVARPGCKIQTGSRVAGIRWDTR